MPIAVESIKVAAKNPLSLLISASVGNAANKDTKHLNAQRNNSVQEEQEEEEDMGEPSKPLMNSYSPR